MINGRGRKIGSIRWRRCSVSAAALKLGATTTAPKRATSVEPGRAVAQKKYAVRHAGNGIQLRIQVGERTALAGDVHHVGGAAVQQELIVAGNLDDILHGRHLFDVSAVREHLIIRDFQTNAGP